MLRWHVGDVVAKLRNQRGWTQLQLAIRAEYKSAQPVRVLEQTGENPHAIGKIADALETTVDALYRLVPFTPERGVEQEPLVDLLEKALRRVRAAEAGGGGDQPSARAATRSRAAVGKKARRTPSRDE